jgi:LmbE family N-acetylglucosaminyl deacetylase
MENILVIAPHPDDETLGCGGTILKYISEGKKVYWLICTEFYRNGKTEGNIKLRAEEIERVTEMFCFTKRFELGYDAATITYADVGNMVSKITNVINEIKPELIFLPNRSDVHTDHQIIFTAAFSCTKHFNFPFIKRVLMYETVSETEFAPPLAENYFLPNVYIDVTRFFDKKLEIMKTYKSEVMPGFLPRSVSTLKALSMYRGSAMGVEYAEAFMLLKEVIT